MKPMRQLVDAILANDWVEMDVIWSHNPGLATDPALWWPLHTAAHKGRVKAVDFLLDHGANVNAYGYYGPGSAESGFNTALHWAAASGATGMVKHLLARGADVHGGNRYLTPLQYAARRRHPDVVEFCSPTVHGWTSLWRRYGT